MTITSKALQLSIMKKNRLEFQLYTFLSFFLMVFTFLNVPIGAVGLEPYASLFYDKTIILPRNRIQGLQQDIDTRCTQCIAVC